MGNLHQLTEQEYVHLEKRLREKGEVFFPLRTALLGTICGSLLRMRRLGADYAPRLSDRLMSRLSESHRCITAFVWRFGATEIDFEATHKGSKQGLLIRLKGDIDQNAVMSVQGADTAE